MSQFHVSEENMSLPKSSVTKKDFWLLRKVSNYYVNTMFVICWS